MQAYKAVKAARVKDPMIRIVTLTVAPDGHVVACEPGEGKGDPRSLEKACDIATSLHYTSTASIDGEPSYGRTQMAIMSFDEKGAKPWVTFPADITFKVNKLPPERNGLLRLVAVIEVSPRGEVERCQASGGKYETYAKLACKQLRNSSRPIVNDPTGQAVRYVEDIKIQFVPEDLGTTGDTP
ncbi:hypothetical protein [Novosphingobium soli]|uniref:TonB C-terminal domain-containing protein n=1 Tax=Novosphingobium soli TaxID=574956 RepID=A0ABV6CVW5_9SPHN